jgi:sec-independent protein translocase protein TatA
MIGTQELIIIFVIVLVLFGGKKIPEVMSGLGQGIRSFKKAMEEDVAPEPPKPPQSVDSEKVRQGTSAAP